MKILNTRAEHQASQLKELLEEQLDCQSIALPLLDIVKIPVETWKNKCHGEINKPDLLIFISTNAVHHSIQYLKQCWPKMPIIAAIGLATNEALKTYNLKAQIIPSESNSESLIKHPALQGITNKTITLIKGEGGRQILQDYIKQQNAKLIEIDVYKRQCPVNLKSQINKIWHQNHIEIILIFSVESMTNLLNNALPEIKSIILNTPCLVIGKRIQCEAIKHGMKKIILSSYLNIGKTIKSLVMRHK